MAGALPDAFALEWHPTRSVYEDVADGEWVVLTGALRELDCEHGYKRSVGRIEAGQLLARAGNLDRSLDPNNRTGPWWPNLAPMRHLRAVAWSGATKYVIWRGYTSSFVIDWDINDGWCDIEAWDSLDAAAAVIAESILHTAIAESDPDIWLPLNDGGAAVALGLGRSPGAQTTSTVGGDAILPFAGTRSTRFPYPGQSRADILLKAPSYQVNPGGFTVAAVFETTHDEAQVILSAGPQPVSAACPSGDVAFVVDIDGTYSLRVGNAAGSTLLQFPQPNNDTSTLVIGSYDPAEISLDASIGLSTVGGGGDPVTTHYAPRDGGVRIGAGLDAANANPFLGNLSHACLWQRKLSSADKFKLFRAFFGRVRYDLSGNQTKAAEVIGWVLDRLRIPASRRDLASGALVLGPTRSDAAAVEMMSRAANTEGGYFHADRQGRYVFRLRGHKGADRGTYDTRPGDTGNRALAGMRLATDDRSYFTLAKMRMTAGSEDGQEITYRHPKADTDGEVPYEAPTQFANATDATAAGVAVVGDATARTEITAATVQAGAQNVNLDDLLASDILDEATLIGRIPGGQPEGALMTWDSGAFWDGPGWAGPPPHTTRGMILSVGHRYDGQSWTTRWSLTPS